MSKIGELLLQRGWIDSSTLQRALAEQRRSGRRLCSLLIEHGFLDPDQAARALGEQHSVAAVLQRHLEGRDPALAELVPTTFARQHCVLPIGVTRGGELIVCARDPSPALEQRLRQALARPVVIAVAPATALESLVDATYPTDEFEVDLGTAGGASDAGDINNYHLADLDDARVTKTHAPTFTLPPWTAKPPFGTDPPAATRASPFASIRAPAHPVASPLAAATATSAVEPELPSLDDADVLEIEDEPLVAEVEHTPPPHELPIRPPDQPPPPMASAVGTVPPRKLSATNVRDIAAALADAATRDAATELALRFMTGRYKSSLVLAVDEGVALGHRGHGDLLPPSTIRAVAIPLSAPSIVNAAFERGEVATAPPPTAGEIHQRIVRLLGDPTAACAAPVRIGGRVACLLAVGDRIGDGDGPGELGELAVALGEAYTRILRDR